MYRKAGFFSSGRRLLSENFVCFSAFLQLSVVFYHQKTMNAGGHASLNPAFDCGLAVQNMYIAAASLR